MVFSLPVFLAVLFLTTYISIGVWMAMSPSHFKSTSIVCQIRFRIFLFKAIGKRLGVNPSSFQENIDTLRRWKDQTISHISVIIWRAIGVFIAATGATGMVVILKSLM